MSLERDDRDHEARGDWSAGQLPLESAAQRLSKRVKPSRRGGLDPTVLGSVVLAVLIGGLCAYGRLSGGGEVQVAEQGMPAPLPSPGTAGQQRLASDARAAAPDPAVSAAPPEEAIEPAPAPPEGMASARPAAGAFRVQLLAMSSEPAAQRAWSDLAKTHPDLLGTLSPNVVRADLGAKGTLYRVQAGPLADRASADELCGALARRGTGCLVVAN